MRSGTETAHVRLVLVSVLTGLLGLSACGDQEVVPQRDEVGLPPSLTTAVELVNVRLTADQARTLAIELFEAREVDENVRLTIPATVLPSPDAFAMVSAPIGGRVVEVSVRDGASVRRGQVVASIESLELATLLADFIEAEAQAQLDRSLVARYQELVREGISPRAKLEEAEASLKRSEGLLRGSGARLSAIGLTDSEVEALSRSARPRLAMRAPIDGVVGQRLIDVGQAVAAHDKMLTVVDGSEVLVRGLASPDQATRITRGDSVVVTSATGGDAIIRARISSISPAVDPEDRAVGVHIIAASGGFRPGQPAVIEIATSGSKPTILVPLSALTYMGDQAVVFVQTAPDTYEQRAVVAGDPRQLMVPIQTGLKAGEAVAVSNVYDLKALVRFDQYGE